MEGFILNKNLFPLLLWKTVWQLLPKIKIESLYDPASPLPLLGMYTKELKAGTWNRYLCTCVHSTVIRNR